MEWEKIFVKYMSNKELSRFCIEPIQLNSKKKTTKHKTNKQKYLI